MIAHMLAASSRRKRLVDIVLGIQACETDIELKRLGDDDLPSLDVLIARAAMLRTVAAKIEAENTEAA